LQSHSPSSSGSSSTSYGSITIPPLTGDQLAEVKATLLWTTSFASLGTAVGSAVPVLGNFTGGLIGGGIGAAVSLWDIYNIESVRDEFEYATKNNNNIQISTTNNGFFIYLHGWGNTQQLITP
jgi:hypothetical protein